MLFISCLLLVDLAVALLGVALEVVDAILLANEAREDEAEDTHEVLLSERDHRSVTAIALAVSSEHSELACLCLVLALNIADEDLLGLHEAADRNPTSEHVRVVLNFAEEESGALLLEFDGPVRALDRAWDVVEGTADGDGWALAWLELVSEDIDIAADDELDIADDDAAVKEWLVGHLLADGEFLVTALACGDEGGGHV